MKKMRAIYDKWTESDVQFLSNLGIIVNVGINRFEIEEDDERYAKIKNYFSNKSSYLGNAVKINDVRGISMLTGKEFEGNLEGYGCFSCSSGKG